MTKGTIKTSVAFSLLNKARKANRDAACQFAVHFVTKSGVPYKNAQSLHMTKEEAKTERARLQALNPGSALVVLKINEGR